MITLTGGGHKSSKKQSHFGVKHSIEPQSVGGLSESDTLNEHPIPDNEYLETMKLRMRGLPDLSSSHKNAPVSTAQFNNSVTQCYEDIIAMDTAEMMNKAS